MAVERLHHFSVEIPKANEPREREFWNILGFGRHPSREMPPRPWIDTWYMNWEADVAVMVQIREEPVIPETGHIALVDSDLERTVRILSSFDFGVEWTDPYYGWKRAWAMSPSGHMVELMEGTPSEKMGPPPNG